MEEFKSFNVNHVKKESEEEIKEEKYHSDLGDFSHLAERIIKFSRGKYMMIMAILVFTGFILTCINLGMLIATDLTFHVGEQTQNMNWMKIILVLALLIASIVPIAIFLIVRGSRKIDVLSILRGLDTINVLLSIDFVLLVLSAIVCGIAFLSLLFRAFILVVIAGAMMFALFYFSFKFIAKAREVVYDISSAFSTTDSSNQVYPTTVKLRPYLIMYLVINIINFLMNLGDSNAALNQLNIGLLNALVSSQILNNIIFVVGLISSIYAIYLTETFDIFIRMGRPRQKQQQLFSFDSVSRP